MSKFGVGYSQSNHSYNCGKYAATKALENLNLPVEKVSICFLFCTSRHDPHEFFSGVKSVVSAARFIGGYSNGAIDNHHVGYDGYQAVVGLLSTDATIDLFMEPAIAFNEYKNGAKLGEQIMSHYDKELSGQMLLFFDAVNRQKGYFQMNYGTPFLNGMKERLKTWPNIAGARIVGDMRFKPTYQWYESEVIQDAAIAMVIKDTLKMDVQVMHGCTPASAYHTVTAHNDALITEIDHIPALDFLERIFGKELSEDYQQLKFFVTIGRNTGDKWSSFQPEKYVNRMCVGIDVKNGGIRMAEKDLVTGTEIQFMRRGFDMEYVQSQTEASIAAIEGRGDVPIFGLYLNCAGRAAAYSDNSEEDATYVQRAIADRFPLMGIYEAGELALVGDTLEVLDWTGILCIFSEATV